MLRDRIGVYAVLTEVWHLLSSVHRHLSGPYSCLALSLTLTEEVLAAVVSGRVKKSGRGHFGLPNDCWNAVVCERVCFYVPVLLSVYVSVCLYASVCCPVFCSWQSLKRFGWHVKEIPVQTEVFVFAFELNDSSIGAGQNKKGIYKACCVCANPHLCFLFTVSCSSGISQPSSHYQEGTAEPGLRSQPVL